MKSFLTIFIFCSTALVSGQCPVVDFSVNPSYCKEQSIELINNSSNFDLYTWYLCPDVFKNSIQNDIVLSPSNALRASYAVSYIKSQNALITIRNNGETWLVPFSDDFTNATNELLISSSVDPFDLPRSVEIIFDEGIWKGLVTNAGSINPTLIEFQDGFVSSNIVSSSISAGGITDTHGSDLVTNSDGIFYFLGSESTNTINLIHYLTSLSDIPSTSNFTLGSIQGASDIEIIKTCSGWKGLVISLTSKELHLLDFGNSLTNTPTSTLLLSEVDGLTAPSSINLFESRGEFFAFIQNESGNLLRVEFEDEIGMSFTLTDMGIVSTNGYGVGVLEKDNLLKGYVSDIVNATKGVYLFDFQDDCTLSDSIVVNKDTIITLSNPASYEITLVAENGQGKSAFTQTLVVLDEFAPIVSFTSSLSRCISNPLTFTPSNPSLSSYSWDFDGDGTYEVTDDNTGANQVYDYSIVGGGPGPGTYTVRLDVSDGTCDNFYEEEITIYDPPPAPSYSYTSPRTCINTDFTFTNNTDDASYTGPLEYLWEFIDEPDGTVVATANTKDAVYAFETEGQKTVRLTSSIPGCIETTEQTLMITSGPSAAFSANSVCQGESMQFTNNSSDATTYSWDFGDGFMSTAENPDHVYTNAGNYFVTLIATDVEGCNDTEIVEVAVSDSPQISIDFDIPCTSADGIQFSDLTTVNNADVVSWNWFVDGVQVSTDQNPIISFSSTGIKEIRLDVQGSNGCESSYTEDIEVLTSPSADFTSSIGCQGEESTFMDNSESTGNPIISWLWTVDGVNYGTQDIAHVFSNPGIYDVSLEVTAQNFCSEIVTKSVEVIELPSVDFSVSGECDNQLIMAVDESVETEDPVVSRRWLLDGENVGNGAQLFLENLAEDSYNLALELETSSGCIITGSQSLAINNAPQSSFTSSRTYGVPEDRLTFTNTSTGGISYQWLLDGVVSSTDPEVENITFSSPGTYQVSLVAQNSLGCNDTTNQEIRIAIPEVDLSIGSFELVDENGTGIIFLEIQNLSNLPVEITEAQIVLENQFSVTEQILNFIDVGETVLVNLNTGIPLTVSEPSYFCVKLKSQYTNYEDLDPINNEKCITIEPSVKVEDPFPNPVQDQFRLKVVMPDAGIANLTILNSSGKIHSKRSFNGEAGLNNFFVEMSALNSGIYYVTVEVLGTVHKRKVIKL